MDTGAPLKTLDVSFYKNLLDELYDGVYFVDCDRIIKYWNKAAEEITGYSADQVIGHCCADGILCHTDDSGRQLCQDGCPLVACVSLGQKQKADVYLRHKQRHRVPVEVRIAPLVSNGGNVIGAVELFRDNTSKKRLERRSDELSRIAYIDPLSGLVNRRYLQRRLQQLREDSSDKTYCLIMFDVDKFKEINDRYGHQAGDVVLGHIAQLISNSLRSTDAVGRWGGEEFLAILPGADLDGAVALANRCRGLVASSAISFDGCPITFSISGGVSQARSGEDIDLLIRRADEALYESKRQGRNRVTPESPVWPNPPELPVPSDEICR